MMQRRILFLPVEVQNRGFHSRFLLGAYAALRGYAALCGPKNPVREMVKRMPPGILVEKTASPSNVDNFAEYRRGRHRIVCLDEEGAACYRRQNYQKRRLCPETVEMTDLFLAWGPLHREVILEAYPDAADKVVVTGNPRIDVWGRPFRELYRPAADALRERFGPYLFLPSNFANGEGHIRGRAFMIRIAEEHHYLDDPADREFLYRQMDHADASFRRFAAFLPALREAFADRALVIRPHPSEKVERWIEAAAGLADTVVELEGPVTPYILGADCLLHHGCTTGIEAHFLGTPIVAFLPDHAPDLDAHPANELSHRTFTEAETIAKIRAVLGGESAPPPGAEETEANFFAYARGSKTASEAILDAFETLDVDSHAFDPDTFGRRDRPGGWVAALKRRIYRMRKRIETAPPPADDSSRQAHGMRKWPGVPLDEARRILAAYARVDPRLGGVRIREIAENLFCLYADDEESGNA